MAKTDTITDTICLNGDTGGTGKDEGKEDVWMQFYEADGIIDLATLRSQASIITEFGCFGETSDQLKVKSVDLRLPSMSGRSFDANLILIPTRIITDIKSGDVGPSKPIEPIEVSTADGLSTADELSTSDRVVAGTVGTTDKVDKVDMPVAKYTGGLYIGGYSAACNPDFMREYGIGAIINCAYELDYLKARFVNSLEYRHYAIDDTEDAPIEDYFGPAVTYIDKCLSGGINVLVHCAAGKSRSAAIVLAYLMWKQKVDLARAYTFLKARRSIINPNPGFIGKLEIFHSTLCKVST
jgi:dual specificity phosphatase 12